MHQHPAPRTSGGLTDAELAILELEQTWWTRAGSKETQVRDRFGVDERTYYALLSALVDRPEAEAHDPLVVRRLRRLRASRSAEHASRARHPAGRGLLVGPDL